jgi:hypothetical protein
MKIKKPNYFEYLYLKCFVTQAKKNIAWFFNTTIQILFQILKLKGITKFNVIMIVNYFYLNNYRL